MSAGMFVLTILVYTSPCWFVLACMVPIMREWDRAAEERILGALADGRWRYGLDLCKAGAASRGVVYLHLSRLEERGLVESKPAPAGLDGTWARRLYRRTPEES